MTEHIAIEAERQAVQAALDAERSQRDRNKLGQFATSPLLAREIARVALKYLDGDCIRLLEPALGTGAFFSALVAEAPPKTVTWAQGIELDERFAAAARALFTDQRLQVLSGDFTRLRPAPEAAQANLVLANPPYVRHHHLDRERKQELRAAARQLLGAQVSGLAGLYVYFILLAHRWLAHDGVAAWLVPSEWMDVNYGASLKEYLCTQVQLLRVHRFDAAEVQFGDALVSSSVIFLRRAAPRADGRCEFTAGELAAPSRRCSVPLMDLLGALKWGPHFRGGARPRSAPGAAHLTLADVAHIRRGIATGANAFFIRPRTEFQALGIPAPFLRPILPSSRYLADEVIGRGPDGFPALPDPRALLDCDLDAEEVARRYPRLWAYLQSPAGQAARTGYLTSGRRRWYAQEQRPHAPVIATYMGRGRSGASPFRFFWNQSDATATNGFLLLIPKGPLAAHLRQHPQRAGAVRDFLAAVDPAELLGHGRVYGGGLHKLEPRELGRLDVSKLVALLGL